MPEVHEPRLRRLPDAESPGAAAADDIAAALRTRPRVTIYLDADSAP
jgi:hypothetical protein